MIYLNGATLMTTPTQQVLEIAREAGYAGIEARAERLLQDSAEVQAAAKVARPKEVLTLNGVALTVRPDGQMDRRLLDAELPPLLRICQEIGSRYLTAIPPRAPGLQTHRAIPGTRDALELARDRADAMGIRIAFEFLGLGIARSTPRRSPPRPSMALMASSSCSTPVTGTPAAASRLAAIQLNGSPSYT